MCRCCTRFAGRGTNSVQHPDSHEVLSVIPVQNSHRKGNFRRLISTSAVRLAAQYAMIYVILLLITLATLKWTSSRSVNDEIETEVRYHTDELIAQSEAMDPTEFSELIGSLSDDPEEDGFLYLLLQDDRVVAGSLHEWPEEIDREGTGEYSALWLEDDVLPGELFEDDAYLPVITTRLSENRYLLVTRHVEQSARLHELSEYLMEDFSLAVALALLLSVVLSTRMLKRMDEVRLTAADIMTGDLTRRVPVSHRNDEFDALASHLNSMLDRIQQLIQGIREVTDNIAHDLRSPLTRLRNQLDITSLEPRSESDYQQAIRNAINEADNLIRTFNSLLSIAQAEAGNHRGEWRSVNLNDLAHDLVDLFSPAAEEKHQKLILTTATNSNGNTIIEGSRDLLAQAIGNLLENAIKYSPEHGSIHCVIKPEKRHVSVEIRDCGPGIPESEHQRVIQRFVRLDDSRQTPGNGLGLSLVSAVASLYQARMIFNNANPGLSVVLKFPRRKRDPEPAY